MNERVCSAFLLSFLLTFSLAAQDPKPALTALTNVTLIDGLGGDPSPGMTVLIEGTAIQAVFRTGDKPVPAGTQAIDLGGHYVIPGMFDTHVHLTNLDLTSGRARVDHELKRLLYSGVTTIRDLAGDTRLLGAVKRELLLGRIIGPDIHYASLMAGHDFMMNDLRVARASAGFRPGQAPWQMVVGPETEVRTAVARASGTGATAIKLYLGIDAPVLRAITEEAHRQGLQVWAHSTVFPLRPMDAVRAGVDVISHVGWLPWEDRDLDPSKNVPYAHTDRKSPIPTYDHQLVQADSPEMKSLIAVMAEHGTTLDATYSYVRTPAGALDGSVSRPARPQHITEIMRAVHRAGIPISTGTDYFAGEAESFPAVFREIEQLVDDGVLTPGEAITAATLNGARAAGIEDTHGTIQPGKAADLVVLAKDPTEDIRALRSVVLVIKNGKQYPRTDFSVHATGTTPSKTLPAAKPKL